MRSAFCVYYHFVADAEATPWPKLVSLRTADFARQLDYLCSRFEPMALEDVRAFYRGERPLPRRGFLLSFDHGTKDHLENVLGELEARSLKAVFFVYTCVQEEGRICAIDKQRFLEYVFDDYLELLRRFAEHALRLDDGLERSRIEPTPENLARSRRYLEQFAFYSDGERFFRQLRDRVLEPGLFARVIGHMFEDRFGPEREFARAHYLSWDDLRELRDAGMEIGGHGHAHLIMDKTPAEEQRKDVARNLGLLRERLGVAADCFSYPNGAYGEATLDVLRQSAVKLAFTTDAETGFRRDRPLEIGRVDTASLPMKPDESEATRRTP